MRDLDRREFIKFAATAGAAMSLPVGLQAQTEKMHTRLIPSTGQPLGIVGFGNASPFHEPGIENHVRARELISLLLEQGGNFIDTNVPTVWAFEERLEPDMLKQLQVVTSVVERGVSVVETDMDHLYQALEKNPLDFLQLRNMFSLSAMDRWPMLKEWKAAGFVKHIGLSGVRAEQPETVAMYEKYINEVDFIQINYSFVEAEAEKRLLPMARDNGVGVITNRPFRNGNYFQMVAGKQLPEWVKEFDCESWAQLSVKWALSNPAVTCVITESSDPGHAIDNLRSGIGRLPDENQREEVRQLIHSFL
jgi:aryl-alcohol dehydrogenase-like predicted oxidoreductase